MHRTTVLAVLLIASVTVLAQPPASTPPPGQQTPRSAQPPASTPPPGQTPRSEQPPTPAPTPRTLIPPAPATPRREGQPVNIKIDFTITDQRGGAPAIKRTLTLLVADERTGSIRTQSQVIAVGTVPLNVDASPTILSDGKVRLGFNLQYDWPAPLEGNPAPRGTVVSTSLHDQMFVILESGKPMVTAQSADPIGDRQVTVEVKATVLR